MKMALRILTVATILLVGFLIGYLPSRQSLQQCQQDKKALTSDLAHAVARGVTTETQLNLCKEEKQ